MGRVGLLTVFTLEVGNDEFDLESLLKHGVRLDLLLNGQLDLNSAGMRFGPDKGRVEKLHRFHTFNVFEADGEELGTFQFTKSPGRPLISVTVTAMLDSERLRDTLSNVNLTLETVDAGVCGVRLGHNTTDAASDHGCHETVRLNELTFNSRDGGATLGLHALSIVDTHSLLSVIFSSRHINSWLE